MDDADVMKDVTVQHLILVRDGRTDESWRTGQEAGSEPLVLRGVSYRHFLPSDTEFPTDSKPPWTIYLRCFG